MKKLQEGKTEFFAIEQDIPVKKMQVFYNRKREVTRDILLKVVNAEEHDELSVAEPLAGSGITGLRLLKELPKKKIKMVSMNDKDSDAVHTIKKNVRLNRVSSRAVVKQQEANNFLGSSFSFDVVNIDPFGTPVPFLESAMRKIRRGGLLIVTATDTASLFGARPASCKRKYWATPSQNSIRKEIGLRILVRKVQMIGASYDKCVVPLLCYAKDHYAQSMFRVYSGKKKADEIIKQHQYIDWHAEKKKELQKYGPVWTGTLFDKKLLKKIKDDDKFLNTLFEESKVDVVGFYDLTVLSSQLKQATPSVQAIIAKLRERGHKVAITHFAPSSIRTTASITEIKRVMKLKSLRK